MPLDWSRLLEQTGVEYVTQGANVARNHINIHCPWCGADDPSHHLSINLDGKGWRCYRDFNHRGKAPARLLSAAAGITLEHARKLCGETTFIPSDWESRVRLAMGNQVSAERELRLPEAFKSFHDPRSSARPFIRYLRGRDFTDRQIRRMTRDYDLRYASRGAQQGRVIFPVYHERRLVSWTGRTIGSAIPRYLSLSPDEDSEPRGIGPISDYLLWYDDLRESTNDTLIMCEGPFDALKVAVLGARYGIDATCCFTAQPSPGQIALLCDVAPRYKRRVLMLDAGTLPKAMRVLGAIPYLDFEQVPVPDGFKDPGDLTQKALLRALA